MKQLLQILKFIWTHPLASKRRGLALSRFIYWQVSQKLHQRPAVYKLVDDSSLIVKKSMAGATGNIYTGLLEFEDMAFVLHVLRKGDLFVDIGANVGVYSILASKNAGATVISIEPVPQTFTSLMENLRLNKIESLVTPFALGLGEKRDKLFFTSNHDTTNHVVPSGKESDYQTVEIPVDTLDSICENQCPSVIKLDVEGYEFNVLVGAQTILTNDALKAIIIELNGCGNLFGHTDEKIHQLLLDHGFQPYRYEPFKRVFDKLSSFNSHNTLYLRDLSWCELRVKNSRKFKVLQQDI